MAFNLRAVLTLDDRMSGRLQQISNRMATLNTAIGRTNSNMGTLSSQLSNAGSTANRTATALTQTSTAANRASSSFSSASRGGNLFTRGLSSMAGGIGSTISSVMSLNGVLLGLSTTYAAVNTAKSVFEATVGNAMHREQSGIVIDAMFNDKKASTAYKAMVEQYAIDSPTMDSKQMFGNSKSFISMTKNVDELKGLWSIVERLAAIDPYQGVEGGVFAMRELLSGDSVSMQKRFEMPKSELNEIKKLDVPGQIAAMNELMEKMGMSQHLIDEMAKSSLGRWMQIKEKWSLMLADMGAPALEPINKFFDDLLERFDSKDFKNYGKIGGRIIASIIEGLSNAVVGVYDWFTALSKTPEFMSKTTLHSKIMFVISDIFEHFMEWFNGGGRDKLEAAGKIVIETLAGIIDASMEIITPVAVKVGAALGAGILDGFKGAIGESSIVSILTGPFGGLDKYSENKTGVDTSLKGLGKQVLNTLSGKGSGVAKKAAPAVTAPHLKARSGQAATTSTRSRYGATKSRNGGLDFVPYDGAEYSLHRGEAILTRGEANKWRRGGEQPIVHAPRKEVRNMFQFGDIHLHDVGVDLEDAADKFMEIMAMKIQQAGEGGA